MRAQLHPARQRLDDRQADSAPVVARADEPRADPRAVIAHDHASLVWRERQLDLHRALASRIGVHDHVVRRFADGGLDVLDRLAELDRLGDARERLAHERDVFGSARKRDAHVGALARSWSLRLEVRTHTHVAGR